MPPLPWQRPNATEAYAAEQLGNLSGYLPFPWASWIDRARDHAPPPAPFAAGSAQQPLAGALLLLISFITNYGDDNLLHFDRLPAHVQVGVDLHLAALAALAGDAQLATRLRHRAANEAAEDRITRKREALEAAEGREQAARRARIQARCLAAQCRFLLADTSRNRLQLSEARAVLLEELNLRRD